MAVRAKIPPPTFSIGPSSILANCLDLSTEHEDEGEHEHEHEHEDEHEDEGEKHNILPWQRDRIMVPALYDAAEITENR